MIKFNKPTIFFDLETTGVNVVSDRIVQIAVRKILPNGDEEKKSVLINPTIDIPKEATDVHGITNEMIIGAPTFKQLASSMYEFFDGCDVVGFNSDTFDIPLLSEEFTRVGMKWPSVDTNYVDVLKMERYVNSHTLVNTYKRYTGKDLDGAHDALNDTNATVDVFFAQIEKFDLPTDISQLTALYNGGKENYDIAGKMYKKDGNVYWNFGKNKNNLISSDSGYVSWFMRADFPSDSKDKLKEALEYDKDLNR